MYVRRELIQKHTIEYMRITLSMLKSPFMLALPPSNFLCVFKNHDGALHGQPGPFPFIALLARLYGGEGVMGVRLYL